VTFDGGQGVKLYRVNYRKCLPNSLRRVSVLFWQQVLARECGEANSAETEDDAVIVTEYYCSSMLCKIRWSVFKAFLAAGR